MKALNQWAFVAYGIVCIVSYALPWLRRYAQSVFSDFLPNLLLFYRLLRYNISIENPPPFLQRCSYSVVYNIADFFPEK